jgi:hypothetical protein
MEDFLISWISAAEERNCAMELVSMLLCQESWHRGYLNQVYSVIHEMENWGKAFVIMICF